MTRYFDPTKKMGVSINEIMFNRMQEMVREMDVYSSQDAEAINQLFDPYNLYRAKNEQKNMPIITQSSVVNHLSTVESAENLSKSEEQQSPSEQMACFMKRREKRMLENTDSKRKERLEKIALKKKRSAFIARQLSGLDEELSTLPYLKKSERLRLAKELDIPERSLKIWYQNQRAKWSKNSRDSQNRDAIGSEILTSEQNSLSIVEQNVLTADISDSVIESSEGAIINRFANTDYPNAHPGFVEKQRFQEILNSIGRSVDNSVHEVPQFNKDYDAFQGPPQKRYRYTDILNPTPDLQSDGSFLQNRPGINHRRSQKS